MGMWMEPSLLTVSQPKKWLNNKKQWGLLAGFVVHPILYKQTGHCKSYISYAINPIVWNPTEMTNM